MSEQALVRSIVDALNLLSGVRAMRLQSGMVKVRNGFMHLCEPGTPDILVMLRGGHVAWIECKAPKGVNEKSQPIWHEMAAKMGHSVRVVRDTQSAISFVREMQGLRGAA